jgi:hypothetical protein
VLRPNARPALNLSAVEGRSVVRLHGAVIAALIDIDELHLLDGKSRIENSLHSREYFLGLISMDDKLTDVDLRIEAPIGQGEKSQVRDSDWAPLSPRVGEP